MQGRALLRSVLVLTVAACAACYSAEPAQDPARSQQRFTSIVTNLDTGGDLLVVANLEGYVQGLVDGITPLLLTAADSAGDPATAKATIAKIPGFLQKNGFYAVQGFGLSVVPLADGLNKTKSFVCRDPAAADLPLWRGLVGGAPRYLKCAAFLPADTVLSRTGTGDPKQLWSLVRSGVAEFGGPQGTAGFEQMLSAAATNMGVNLDAVIASFGEEGFFSVQLSRSATVELPAAPGAAPVKIPRPALLIGIALQDGTLLKAVESSLARAKVAMLKTPAESIEIRSVNLPVPAPFPVQPSFTIYSNFFLFGSTPEVVSDAIKAFNGKSGLIAMPEYRQAVEGLPVVNNGVFYLSPRLLNTIRDVQKAAAQGGGEQGAQMAGVVQRLLGAGGDVQSAFVVQNLNSGVLTTGRSTSGGKEMVGSVLMAPAGLMAAIAIPSFMKARTTSVQNACINNLRMIDAAKEQWALENNKAAGQAVDAKDIVDYLKGGQIPVCPQGGTYKLNPIGNNPECNIPGHALR